MPPEFQSKLQEFLVERLLDYAGRPTRPLYHYTGGNGLIKIINTGTLLASQIGTLNDSMELAYATMLLQQRMADAVKNDECARSHAAFARIADQLTRIKPEATGVYVTSFTEDGDSLSQWRGYADGEAGFAIEFDPAVLSGASCFQPSYLLKVEYHPDRQNDLLGRIVRWTDEAFAKGLADRTAGSVDAWAEEFAPSWIVTLAPLTACLKHPKFEAEREWRIVYYFRDGDLQRMQFVQRRATISRHIPLTYGATPSDTRLPVTGVVMGPCRYPDSTRYAVADLLRARGYGTDVGAVAESKIPYRLI
ncbi:MAG TPA: DUF2971 domain-containing protein [Geminicoccus sp.]|jgi:hypothetical protein|uniref:DUF2971 domain-containing protein n=1 Tax=Geminicoccus sp. TaxID=2024832 RepID=UPI002E331BC6|nr:DUF2971 domain-containing protein [Geminicoccus sp.]HEX2528755.1 DUF2971 domain-containing protein [Geminicoccus sp.]